MRGEPSRVAVLGDANIAATVVCCKIVRNNDELTGRSMRSSSHLAGWVALGVAANLPATVSAQDDRPVFGNMPGVALEVYHLNPPGVAVETLFTDLDVVWSLEFAPDGRLFITEKAGRIRVARLGPAGPCDLDD